MTKLETYEIKKPSPYIDIRGRHTPGTDPTICCRCGEEFTDPEANCYMPFRIHSDLDPVQRIEELLENGYIDLPDPAELRKIGVRTYTPPKPKKEPAPKKEKTPKKKKLPPPPPEFKEPETPLPPPPDTEETDSLIEQRFKGQKTIEGGELRYSRKDFSAREYKKFLPKEALNKRTLERKELLSYFGFVPMSILPIEPGTKSTSLDNLVEDRMAKGTYSDHTSNKDTVVRDMEKYKNQFQGLSQYKTKVAEFIIKMWGTEGGLLLEPFAGRMPIMLIGNSLGMNAIGYEIWEECYQSNIEKMSERITSVQTLSPDDNQILNNDGKAFECTYNGLDICLYRQDSRYMTNLDDNIIDLAYTSPPFWKTETYGDEPEQLGLNVTYPEFLKNLEDILKEVYRVLKPGGYLCWDINNFRHGGEYYNFYADSYNIARKVGFIQQDEVIYKTGNMSAIFAARNTEQDRVAKIHIYIQVYKKPE